MKVVCIAILSLAIISSGAVLMAHAQDGQVTISDLHLEQIPGDPTQPTTPADLVQRLFAFAIYIAGTLAVVMIVYGGVRYVVSGGNESSKREAKDIITGAVWGIVLLAGGWLILNTINPNLVKLSNLGLEQITIHGNETEFADPGTQTGGSQGGTAIACTTETLGPGGMQEIQNLANQLLSGPNVTSGFVFQGSSNATCEPAGSTSPYGIVSAIAAGNLPYVCDWAQSVGTKVCSGACAAGGSSQKQTVCPNTLRGLLYLQGKVKSGELPGVTISSLTGGLHVASSAHYRGQGVDMFPSDGDYEKLRAAVIASGGGQILYPGNDAEHQTHLHAVYGGAKSIPQDQVAETKQQIQDTAKLLTDMSVFKGDGSYGLPPSTREFVCKAGGSSSSSADSSPYQNIVDVAAGKNPLICNRSDRKPYNLYIDLLNPDFFDTRCGICQEGNVTLSLNLLKTLLELQNMKHGVDGKSLGVDYRVLAITGGIQVANGRPSEHYSGRAFDIVPVQNGSVSKTRAEWITLRDKILSISNTLNIPVQAFFEYDFIKTGGDRVTFIVRHTKADQATINGDDADEEDNPDLMSCGQLDFSSAAPSYLYAVYQPQYDPQGVITGGVFEKNDYITEKCYNPRIQVVL